MIALSRRPISDIGTAITRLLRWKWAVGMSVVFALCMMACTPQEVMELQLAAGINHLRTEQQHQPLPVDPVLSSVARARAEDMAQNNYFSHEARNGCDYRCLMSKHGISIAWAGEVIAWSNYPLDQAVPMTIGMWRNSPSHFGIITNRCFTRMGTGAAIAPDGRTYHVAVFEGGAPGCPP